MHTVFSLMVDCIIGIRGAMLNAFEANMNIAVDRVRRERRRDGGSDPT